MTLRNASLPKALPLLGVVFLVAAWFAADAGAVVPILGVLVALLAPDLFLGGIAFISIWAANLFTSDKRLAAALALALTVLLGLNTRIPAITSDILHGTADNLQLTTQLKGAVGHPVHIVAGADLQARQRPYSSALPDCYGDGCLGTKGFTTPSPKIEADYWHESVTVAALSAGFVQARPDEGAPTLVVKQDLSGDVSTIHLALLSVSGKVLSKYIGRYRNGFPFETKDGTGARGQGEQLLRLEYLLHGNLLNTLIGRLLPNGGPYPLAGFLREAANLSHPQGSELGLASRAPRLAGKYPSNVAALVILEDKGYEPPWKPTEIPDPNGYASKWQGMPPWDKERHDRCGTLLKPEIKAPITQTWYLFVNDPSGRKKVRISSMNAFCDPDALWFLDYVAEEGNVVVTKYRINGDLAYRLSFKKPSSIPGYMGGIPISTFEAEGGFLRFEWWETNHSASRGMEVKRVLKVRLREPVSAP